MNPYDGRTTFASVAKKLDAYYKLAPVQFSCPKCEEKFVWKQKRPAALDVIDVFHDYPASHCSTCTCGDDFKISDLSKLIAKLSLLKNDGDTEIDVNLEDVDASLQARMNFLVCQERLNLLPEVQALSETNRAFDVSKMPHEMLANLAIAVKNLDFFNEPHFSLSVLRPRLEICQYHSSKQLESFEPKNTEKLYSATQLGAIADFRHNMRFKSSVHLLSPRKSRKKL